MTASASLVVTGTGTTYSVSASLPATYDEAGFDALTFTGVAEGVSIPSIGPVFEQVDHKALDRRNVVKRKGTVDYGSTDMGLGWSPTDAGQVLLIAGADGANVDQVYSHKIEYPTGDVKFFTSQIFSYTTEVADTDSIIGSTVSISLDNTIVDVAAP